jgi:hypothetical protein
MAKFQSDNQFLTVWVGTKKIEFTSGFAQTEDKEVIEALKKNPRVRILEDTPAQEVKAEPKKEAKTTKKATKKKGEK